MKPPFAAQVLVVAHRLATIADSDTLLVFDRGLLVEMGPPNHLTKVGGHYSRMLMSHSAADIDSDDDIPLREAA